MRKFKVENIHCEGCIQRIKNIIDKNPNIKEYSLTLEDKILKINASDEEINNILSKLDDLGFPTKEL